ncbi:hypothetical protein Vadar_026035 [Vaccinium darrowii]|uniref:Uncharacterized protein n=1 Tax=Vaccinium darrowii TaxID=229202 RepID=A0ACB7Y333_9ERIC|nr:hypothetical protein Vadar_026035 [Vaccinium darrowii]
MKKKKKKILEGEIVTMEDGAAAYMPMVTAGHTIPTMVTRSLPRTAQIVTPIAVPRKPTSNIPTSIIDFT